MSGRATATGLPGRFSERTTPFSASTFQARSVPVGAMVNKISLILLFP